MAVSVITVDGKVIGPSGVGVPGGEIRIELLPAGGSTDDGGTQQVLGSELVVAISSAGVVDFDLVPNDLISPSGSKYQARFRSADGRRWSKLWNVLSTDGATQNIGDLSDS
jgi:hypothetical protein